MKVLDAQTIGFRAPEVGIFTVTEVPPTADQWADAIGGLDLRQVFGGLTVASLVPHPDIRYTMKRQPGTDIARDWWAPDHIWHLDGSRWAQQPVFTVIGCREAAEGAPGTELLDTVRLYEILAEEDFWRPFGLTLDDLGELRSEFQDSNYQRRALPFMKGFMDEADQARVEAIVANDIADAQCQTFEEFVAKMDKQYPIKHFPFVRQTPVSGATALFLDNGVRNARLLGPDDEDFTAALHAIRWEYLRGETPQELGLVRAVGCVANQCLIFPQIGTLHRTRPGNKHERELHLGFLVEPQAIAA